MIDKREINGEIIAYTLHYMGTTPVRGSYKKHDDYSDLPDELVAELDKIFE